MRVALLALATAVLLGCARPPDSPIPVLDAPEPGERWMVINYWAIWCGPCREEIPELNTLSHRGLVAVYGVNFDEPDFDTLVAQALELGIQFPLLAVDPGPALGTPRPTKLPATLIVRPDGVVAARLFGPQTAHKLEAEIARLGREASAETQG